MNSRNDKLKTTLLRPEGIAADVEEKDALSAQVWECVYACVIFIYSFIPTHSFLKFQTAMESLRSKKRELQALQAKADALKTDHTQATSQANAIRTRLEQLQQSVAALGREVQDQEVNKGLQ